MNWSWRLEQPDGATLELPNVPTHTNQSDAESWLGEQWRQLAADGVARATLYEGDRKVYGPMPLAED